jgi:hypothetical protein
MHFLLTGSHQAAALSQQLVVESQVAPRATLVAHVTGGVLQVLVAESQLPS